MGEEEIAAFLSHLAIDRRVAASTQNQAFSALLFLYQHVLDRKLEFIAGVERVRRPARLPVVFSKGEARAVLAHLKGDYRLMADLLYGSGLRLLEAARLRVKDIDFSYNRITIHESKGQSSRVTILPARLKRPFQAHLGRVRELHRQDLAHLIESQFHVATRNRLESIRAALKDHGLLLHRLCYAKAIK